MVLTAPAQKHLSPAGGAVAAACKRSGGTASLQKNQVAFFAAEWRSGGVCQCVKTAEHTRSAAITSTYCPGGYVSSLRGAWVVAHRGCTAVRHQEVRGVFFLRPAVASSHAVNTPEHAKQAATIPSSGRNQPVRTLRQYFSFFPLLHGGSCCAAPRARMRRKRGKTGKMPLSISDPGGATTFPT